jgi:hypothetical protein
MAICDYCGDEGAITKCEVCGSMVCGDCKLEYGCKAFGGGEQNF